MSSEDRAFIEDLKKSIIGIGVGLIFTIIATGISFYFTTKERLKNTDKTVMRLEKQVETKADKELVEVQYKSLLREIRELRGGH